MALPIGDQNIRPQKGKSSSPVRPSAGPVVPLTGAYGGSEKVLLGGPNERRPASDPVASRVGSTDEAVAAPPGRADDFKWPRGDITTDGASVKQ